MKQMTTRNTFAIALSTALAVCCPVGASAHPLSDLAASMSPGTWAELPTNNFGGGALLETYSSGRYVLQYCEDAVWDPLHDQILFIGASHGNTSTETLTKFLRYDAATNTWASNADGALPNPPSGYPSGLGHCYDHSAINPVTGIFYHRLYGEAKVMQFDSNTAAWGATLNITSMGPKQVAGALEYFPDLGPSGSLIFVDGDWGVHRYNFATSVWNAIASGNGGGATPQLAMGAYHNFAEYNPVHKVMLFGGGNGSTKLYKINSSGNITSLRDAPFGLGTTDSIVTVDPVSGRYLVLFSNSRFYEYDVQTDVWNLLPSSRNPSFFGGVDGSVFGTIAAPIAEYNVVMFVNYEFAPNSRVFLYKHEAGPLPPVPSAPVAVSAN